MARLRFMRTCLIAAVAVCVTAGWHLSAQNSAQPTSDLPNPYQTIENSFQLPEGRTWGATSAIDVGRDGRTIWVAERCGGNSACMQTNLDPVLHFDAASGKLLGSFGAGLIASPHGIHVDRDGNIWVTDYSDNAPAAARGAGRGAAGRGADGRAAAGPRGRGAPQPIPRPGATKGHQVIKFSPEGKVLLTLGPPGGAAPPACCYTPTDVVTNAAGDIFVAVGHGSNGRIMKFARDGTFVKSWGEQGAGRGQFATPHALAIDARGRIFVADRGNNRIQIFDQEGTFLDEGRQFGRLSDVFIDQNDVLYGADSESDATRNPGFSRGIRIGSARDGKVTALIPDPEVTDATTSAAEGVAVDRDGNVYGAQVGTPTVKKYVKR
jgi:sugar lactone lactonase YvrE